MGRRQFDLLFTKPKGKLREKLGWRYVFCTTKAEKDAE